MMWIINTYVIRQGITNRSKFSSRASRPEDLTEAEEKGTLIKTSEGKAVLKVNGTFSYNPTCDHIVIVRYTADENGYVPHVTQSFHRKLEKVDDKIVGLIAICPVAACLASLQGGCLGK
ncbi:hypothetical protein ILUMI_19295 [Ignelater luminosus]|uniref:Uncharacterized protein n=1 Tax=Ignelater luminosus TaxID=2038154 RepID=A0A8K0CLZ4_IGNLU|nr:hypothetical protein ILUMI_19295 [Ignelater luminosus]